GSCRDTRCAPGRRSSTSPSSFGATARSASASTRQRSTRSSISATTRVTSIPSSSAWPPSRTRRSRYMPETVHVASGKVRELYELDNERLLLIASDRISVFDVVLPTEIPDKGRVLTGLSVY